MAKTNIAIENFHFRVKFQGVELDENEIIDAIVEVLDERFEIDPDEVLIERVQK